MDEITIHALSGHNKCVISNNIFVAGKAMVIIMNKKDLSVLVDPISKENLYFHGKKLCSAKGKSYKVVIGVPVMLTGKTPSLWRRELVEAILWEYPEEVDAMYDELSSAVDYSTVYIRYIEKLLKNKDGIISALYRYAEADRAVSAAKREETITRGQKNDFRRYAKKKTGEKRTATKINAAGSFAVYPHFAEAVNGGAPRKILELGTGAGGATAAIALGMTGEETLYTVDIDFACLGNAVGIRKYQRKNIVPVCADFWLLPFADGSVDSVCTYNGLDESRENGKTLSEVARVLKKGGSFVVVSRKNAFMRQGKILSYFGFGEEETVGLMKKCRLYSDTKDLCSDCENCGIRIEKRTEFDMGGGLVYVLSEGVRL